ncbi:hypothetical protein GCM10010381_28310 [Streptomyces xantholiticus]|nr:hypothetical protein GCM10010381_28310 [Streptomyces xantholiticus]
MRTVIPASLANSSMRYSRASVTPEAYVVPPVTCRALPLPLGMELLYPPNHASDRWQRFWVLHGTFQREAAAWASSSTNTYGWR